MKYISRKLWHRIEEELRDIYPPRRKGNVIDNDIYEIMLKCINTTSLSEEEYMEIFRDKERMYNEVIINKLSEI